MPALNTLVTIVSILLLTPPSSIKHLDDQNDDDNSSFTSRQNPSVKESYEDTQYWKSQRKYLVDPEKYYGSMPEELEKVVFMMQHKEAFEKAGLYKNSNFIFYGPPGVGKTFVGSIFAQKIGADFMYVQGSELQDCYVGGHRKAEELFAKARRHRDATGKQIVMFIDEIDATVGSRDGLGGENANQQQMIAALLKEIGSNVNNGIIVVAATNRINSIDQALLRSGRMEHHIKFTYPTLQDRTKFLEFLVKPYLEIFDINIDWTSIALLLEGKSYADITKIVDNLKQECVIKKINTSDEKTYLTEDEIRAYILDLKKK